MGDETFDWWFNGDGKREFKSFVLDEKGAGEEKNISNEFVGDETVPGLECT